MKKLSLITVLLFTLVSCQKPDDDNNSNNNTNYDVTTSYSLTDIKYGSDQEQKMDVYLPANRNSETTKVFVLIHGGGWSAGDKADYNSAFATFRSYYPNHAIININYRLGTSSSAGYPKQINDIQAALNEIQKTNYTVSKQYLLYGGSAGGHLSMLYAYAFDPNHYVKGVINTVGPADFTDTAFRNNTALLGVFAGLVGTAAYSYSQNQALFEEVSPAKRVTPASPPTLSFYGDQDPLIPATQLGLLRTALDAKGIYHVDTMYAGAGHATFNTEQTQDVLNKTVSFINQFFN